MKKRAGSQGIKIDASMRRSADVFVGAKTQGGFNCTIREKGELLPWLEATCEGEQGEVVVVSSGPEDRTLIECLCVGMASGDVVFKEPDGAQGWCEGKRFDGLEVGMDLEVSSSGSDGWWRVDVERARLANDGCGPRWTMYAKDEALVVETGSLLLSGCIEFEMGVCGRRKPGERKEVVDVVA